MFRRPLAHRPRSHLCQICEFMATRRLPTAKRPLVTLHAGKSKPRISQEAITARPRGCGGATRLAAARAYSSRGPERQAPPSQEMPDLNRLAASVDLAKKAFLSREGIPSEADTAAALRACANAADVLLDAAVQPQLSSKEHQSGSAASNLLSLDANGPARTVPEEAERRATSTRLRDMVAKISGAAYAIIRQSTVFITPQLLEQYVGIQARLGRPETLPQVFLLYASKPLPRSSAGSIKLVPQNPNKAANAVNVKVTETALDTAIEARNLDAAVGIIENSYASRAFIRAKLVRKALLPASAFAATPLAAWGVASNLSQLQDSMDSSTATSIAFAGILAYVGFTAAIGMVAATTANDQMKRVTWAPGTPLRQRWIREDERAALDKVACSFGFSEAHRYGEEEGAQFQSLRKYLARKGMVMDQIELMEGMEG